MFNILQRCTNVKIFVDGSLKEYKEAIILFEDEQLTTKDPSLLKIYDGWKLSGRDKNIPVLFIGKNIKISDLVEYTNYGPVTFII